MKRINNLIVVSDEHCGCQFGLCPPKGITLDGGGRYNPSDLQKKVWGMHDFFWDEWVPMVTKGEPYAICINGDPLDGRHHNSTTQVSHNLADQRHIGEEVLLPRTEGHITYMVRGTPAHSGEAGENEEILAETLNCTPDSIGNYARNELWVRIHGEGGCLVHLLHHIGTTGSTHYESSAVNKELVEEFNEAARWGEIPPDVCIRSHRHRHTKVELDTHRGYGISEVTPGWQLKTPFAYKIAGARMALPQFGGLLVRQGDEEFYTRSKVWSISRNKPEEI